MFCNPVCFLPFGVLSSTFLTFAASAPLRPRGAWALCRARRSLFGCFSVLEVMGSQSSVVLDEVQAASVFAGMTFQQRLFNTVCFLR